MADSTPLPASPRLGSLDAYRGFIMLAMASSGFAIPRVAKQFPDSDVWQFLSFQFDHVPWTGCSFWDLIQPSFMFMVGVAMPYSFASRQARGDSAGKMLFHAIIRSIVLILLGIFLSSNGQSETNYTFVNVLTQIGLGYLFVYLLIGRGLPLQIVALAIILAGYWLYFYRFGLPDANFDARTVGVPENFEKFTGLFAHWDKNTNAAAGFDLWFLKLFPRANAYLFNDGGYQTLNFVPSMATMLFGLMAGELLRSERSKFWKLAWLVVAGAACLVGGLYLGQHVCPIVKRIWTPSWAVYSTGWTLIILAGFSLVIDMIGLKGWAFPLVVVGMNSILMYCMAQLSGPWVRQSLQTHFGSQIFKGQYGWYGALEYDPIYGPIVAATATLFVWWLVCLWLYRQKLFVRI